MSDLEPLYIRILILIATLVGFAVASYIRYKKSHKAILVCPLHSDCNAVVHSTYSRFLGIPVELLGMLYYGFFLAAYSTILFSPIFSDVIEGVLRGLALFAVLFSSYLIFVQIKIIKEWCFWCFLSFMSSLIIFSLFVLI
ncbi:MAG: vitamin K epoxide reductase family protein [Candidatus Yanofskybacteria bacterium]|nr:vitamin K epoxide reductase family protein [Candidatus Yanofskybacteria bacterium]